MANDALTSRRLTTEIRFRYVAEWLDPNSSILDLGAGNGFGYELLLAKNIRITSVDLNNERLSDIPKDPKVSVVNARIEDFLKEEIDNSSEYDAVILGELIEHIPLWRWYVFLSGIFKITNRIIITTPFEQDQLRYLSRHIEQYRNPDINEPYIHKVFGITPEIFKILGFNVIRMQLMKIPTIRRTGDSTIRYWLRDLILSLRRWHSKFLVIEISRL